jgi:hypothetical protein
MRREAIGLAENLWAEYDPPPLVDASRAGSCAGW